MAREWTIYLLLINAAAFLAFGEDKRRAKRREWRISEATLLGLAAAGGALGALIGMRFFHHKTRKRKFTVGVPALLLAQIILMAKWG